MPQVNVPMWDCPTPGSGFNNAGTTIPSNVCLVPDSGADRGVKVPPNGPNNTVIAFAGVAIKPIPSKQVGAISARVGDAVVLTANGAIAKGGKVFISTADAGKEGRPKAYTSFGVDGVVFLLGDALTTAADGELVEIRLSGLYVKTA